MLDAPFHCGSVSGKVPADVPPGDGAEYRIGHRVRQHVGIRVARQPLLGGHGHSPEHERPPLDEPVQVVTDADARGGRRAFPAGDRFGSLEVRHRGDLQVGRLSGDDPHREAGGLGEGRFVGGHRAAPARLDGRGEDIGAERLGRLGEEDPFARHRALDDDRAGASAGGCQLHRVARRKRRQRRARFRRGVNRARDQIGARERAGRVVDHHDVRPAEDRFEPEPHRVLPPRAARDDAHRLAGRRRGPPAPRRQARAAARRRSRRCDRAPRTA